MIHPTALVETERVGPGTRIWGFTHVQAGASIGRDCTSAAIAMWRRGRSSQIA